MNLVNAGEIRTIEVDSKVMRRVYLKLGQSTILRFKEKPKKVVVGNQNYFSIEFVENDLTIQPQENVTSNLFVYGEYHTYGLILVVDSNSYYDDLVNVNWKRRYPAIVLEEPKEKPLQRSVLYTLKKEHSFRDAVRGVCVVDIRMTNKGEKTIKTSEVGIEIIRANKKIPATIVWKGEEIAVQKSGMVRLVYPYEKEGVTIQFDVTGSVETLSLEQNLDNDS